MEGFSGEGDIPVGLGEGRKFQSMQTLPPQSESCCLDLGLHLSGRGPVYRVHGCIPNEQVYK